MVDQKLDLTKWYRKKAPLYSSLGESVKATVVSLLKTDKISFVSVEFRVKTLDSLLTKFSTKNYSSTKEITDLLGLRVIL